MTSYVVRVCANGDEGVVVGSKVCLRLYRQGKKGSYKAAKVDRKVQRADQSSKHVQE